MVARFEVAIGDRPEPDPPQTHHRVTDGLAHQPDLPRPAFVQHHRNQRLVRPRPEAAFDDARLGGRGTASFDGEAPPQAVE